MKKMCIRDSNEAIGEAAVRGGIRFFAGYPITPQSELPEYLSWRLPDLSTSSMKVTLANTCMTKLPAYILWATSTW